MLGFYEGTNKGNSMHVVVGLLLVVLCWASPAWSVSELLYKFDTGGQYWFGDMPEQDPDANVDMTLSGLPASRGRVSNQVNRGSETFASLFRWQCQFALAGTPTGLLGTSIEVYIARSRDGAVTDNSVPTTDTQLVETATRSYRNNLLPVGRVFVDNETGGQAFRGGGERLEIPWRYWQLVVWNPTTQDLAAVGTTPSYCVFTPYKMEAQ